VAEQLQAGPYERCESRQGYRNGYRDREVSWQRCQTHFKRNILDSCPKALQGGLKTRLKLPFDAPDMVTARKLLMDILTDFSENGGLPGVEKVNEAASKNGEKEKHLFGLAENDLTSRIGRCLNCRK
jgi:hypothetical protein